jgi:DNA-binding protein YbaB
MFKNAEAAKMFQEQFAAYQKTIKVSEQSEQGSIAVTMDGNLEITSLHIEDGLSVKEIEAALPDLINKVIKAASSKIQKGLLEFQKQMSQG